jgi:RimJ/RimL family protein N-acetyltransferase
MFIRTERLFLRPVWPEDADALFGGIADWTIVSKLATAPWPYAHEDAVSFCTGKTLSRASATFLVFKRATPDPELVGGIGFGPLRHGGTPDLGFWIARQHQGQGYAVEAGRGLIALAFDGLGHDRLAAGHFVDNPASGKVLRRLGFMPTGEVSQHHCLARGCAVDTVEYGLSAAGWRTERRCAA